MADPEVKDLLNKANWRDERRKLRDIILDCGLEERVKWGKLCYAYGDSNVVIIYGMKNQCALGFFKGSLLEDEDDVLVQPGKHSQAMRQLRFENLKKIEDGEDTIRRFITRAIQAERDGREVEFTEKGNLIIPTNYGTPSMTIPNLRRPSMTLHRGGNAAGCFISPTQSSRKPENGGSTKHDQGSSPERVGTKDRLSTNGSKVPHPSRRPARMAAASAAGRR